MSVVGAKIGTKAWSDAPQNEITKSDGRNTNSAQDIGRLGGQDVGDLLNKVADPNYVDPAKRMRAVGSDKMDKDAFMKLMLAQMKNQDPTNPLKSHEMAAQLAQFTSVEQLQNINSTLGDMQKGQKPAESFQALNFIGKAVSGDSAKVIRMKGDKTHEFNFALNDDAKDAELKIRNQDGEVVRTVKMHDLKKGENKWMWNGKNEAGNSAPVGEYQIGIEAKNSAGKKLFVKTDFSGTISGVSYTAEGPVLMVGQQSVKLKDVKRIEDPNFKGQQSNGKAIDQKIEQKPVSGPSDQKTATMTSQDLKTPPPAADTEDKGAEEPTPTAANLMTSVGMSNGMMDRFKKETAPDAPVVAEASARGAARMIPETKPEPKAESTSKGLPQGGKMPGSKAPGAKG